MIAFATPTAKAMPNEPQGMVGLRFGADEKAVRSASFTCQVESGPADLKRCFSNSGITGYGNVGVKNTSVALHRGKMVEASVTFDWESFGEYRLMMEERFGKPSASSASGEEWVRWKGDAVTVTLQRINKYSELVVRTNEFDALVPEFDKQRRAASADALFKHSTK